MASIRAPKQWTLTKHESINTFEAWKQNLQYVLSLDPNFAGFLVDGFTWLKKTNATPLRGLTNDGTEVDEELRRTAAQKCAHLELMLGQIANYCPVISRNTIVKNSTSIKGIWQSIRLHFGFQTSGGHFLDLNNIHLETGERPEDLYQRLVSFVEDNLLRSDGTIRHNGEVPDDDEELTPTLENFIVLTWLRLIHPELPALVKQRYGTELRSQTLASLKPEISLALNSLLDELHSSADAKILRTALKDRSRGKTYTKTKPSKSSQFCILCKQSGRPHNHFLSACNYLPEDDRRYMTKVRQTSSAEDPTDQLVDDEDSPLEDHYQDPGVSCNSVALTRRVVTKQSPFFKAFYKQYPLQLTLDTGAEISMIRTSAANFIGANITKSNQSARQADGITPLEIVGETRLTLTRGNCELFLEALVVNDLDVDILAGIPFMSRNDISVRPAKQEIIIGDCKPICYGSIETNNKDNRVRRTQAFVLRGTAATIWPGDFIELDAPKELQEDCVLAIEPRIDLSAKGMINWPHPHLSEAVAGKIRILNDTNEPQRIRKDDHVCQVSLTVVPDMNNTLPSVKPKQSPTADPRKNNFSDPVQVDPDNILLPEDRQKFKNLLKQHDNVFDPNIKGYNGKFGKFEATVNMGPTLPPQRKGRVPQYAKDKLVELQEQFDNLEQQGVFKKPEDLDITAEYLNPSFLVKKPNGSFRLVTAFTDVARYCKPQPSLMPNVDSTLRSIGQWRYIIVTDLTKAFYQIPLSRSSIKYCGVATPYRGVRVYTRCAMGMPGSETALEELMSRILGDLLQEGVVAKLADDLYCGGETPEELLYNWERVLNALDSCNLRLSASKTIVCPKTTTILGWIWSQGKLSASPHRIATLSSCKLPETVKGLRSFIGAYKVLGRVVKNCSKIIAPLDDMIAGKSSQEHLSWTDDTVAQFAQAQSSLSTSKEIILPRPDDQLWIVTDGSVTKHGIGATLYVARNNKLSLGGFFSSKLRKHQVTWLPCEIEALCIAAAIKHFSPYIIQSKHQTCLLTDSKPCVQSIEKLCRGEFSASPRVTSFLSIVSRYQINVRHLAGTANIPSDFSSRNAQECKEPRCQICSFINITEDSVVRTVQINDVINDTAHLPFTSRAAWRDIQSECSDLRRAHAHLKQGTRPSKKITNLKDVKRYLNVASISRDNLLVVKRDDPLLPTKELIIVPRSVLDGLVTALHVKLAHPSKHQLLMVMKRHFYALDLSRSVDIATDSCHSCAAIKSFPDRLIKQSSETPPEAIGLTFAADIIKRQRQLILVVRETVTSFTCASLIQDERAETLRNSLAELCLELHPIDGPPAVIRVDPAPGFLALRNDEHLRRLNLVLEIGRVKNKNKNPVAEKAIFELEQEILRYEPGGGTINSLGLKISISRLNSRIRSNGLSARELWTQRNQFNHEQLPISDMNIIIRQHETRQKNHGYSELSKQKSKEPRKDENVDIGDLVYLYSDKNKLNARDRYLVTSLDNEWCVVRKFTGSQLRATSYRVKRSECYRVPPTLCKQTVNEPYRTTDEDDDLPMSGPPPEPVCVPEILSKPENSHGDIIEAEQHIHTFDTTTIEDETVIPQLSDHNNSTDVIDALVVPDESCNAETSPNVDIPEVARRPVRNRRPPRYLNDYVMD